MMACKIKYNQFTCSLPEEPIRVRLVSTTHEMTQFGTHEFTAEWIEDEPGSRVHIYEKSRNADVVFWYTEILFFLENPDKLF